MTSQSQVWNFCAELMQGRALLRASMKYIIEK
jgi:hypothetical protein